MDVVVRPGRPEDVDAWLDLFAAVAAERRWIGLEPPFPRDQRRQDFTDALSSSDATVLVAVADGRIVGGLHGRIWLGIADLGMFVDAGSRGRGIGTALVDAYLGWARGRDAHKVTLEVWPHNEAARGLYERFGFAVEGRRRRHWRRADGSLWDSLVMGLVLDKESPGGPTPA